MGNEQAKLNRFQKEIFDLKFRSKQMGRQSQKFEKEVATYKKKCKKAMENGNMDVAKIHKQNAANQMLKLQSRIDGVVSRMESMLKQRQVTKMLSTVSKQLDPMINDKSLMSMSVAMDKFETQFENLDIESKVMEEAIDNGTASAFKEDQVDELMQQIAAENALDVEQLFEEAGIGQNKIKSKVVEETEEDKEVTQKLQGMLNTI